MCFFLCVFVYLHHDSLHNPSDPLSVVRPVLSGGFYNPIALIFTEEQMKQYRKKVKTLICLSDVSTKLNTYVVFEREAREYK